jgi:polysaccharide export outer membrane protein
MTFMEAIAIAGGYSYRAKKGVVFVKRGGAEDEVEMDVHEKVQPGDIIRIAERLF